MSMMVLVLTAAAAPPALAQGTDGARHRLGAGLSFMKVGDAPDTGTGFVLDFEAGVMSRDAARVGIVGDLSFHGFDYFKTLGLLGGVRVTATSNPKVNVFGQFLVGVMRTTIDDCDSSEFVCADNNTTFAPGGGVDVRLTDRVALRVQVDLVIIKFFDGESFSKPRFWFGVSLPLGGQ